ncbi:MAG: hypothetical protein SOX31_08450, partial [Eubacteriales bacterium]|nr:hypothetical protein [Eubacteriales bacterium]
MPSLQSALSAYDAQAQEDLKKQAKKEPKKEEKPVYETDGNAAREPEYEPADERSIGHDLSRFDQRPDVREARRSEVRETPARRKKTAPRPKVNVVSLLLAAAAALLSAALIHNYVQLTVLNDRLASGKTQYEELANTGILLKTKYESRYDLTEIEEYAQAKLGMTKMERSQIEYVEIGSPDTITRVSDGVSAGKASFEAALAEKINAVL